MTGSDPAFCSGLDLRELSGSGQNARPRQQRDSVSAGERSLPVITPIVGAVNGAAVTGGLEIALNCDVLVASERATFADTHLRVGVMPGGGLTALLPRRVGMGKALEMALTGVVVDAPAVLDCGLVDRVVPHAELIPTAVALAAAMAEKDPETLRYLVETFRRVAAIRSQPAGSSSAPAATPGATAPSTPLRSVRRKTRSCSRGAGNMVPHPPETRSGNRGCRAAGHADMPRQVRRNPSTQAFSTAVSRVVATLRARSRQCEAHHASLSPASSAQGDRTEEMCDASNQTLSSLTDGVDGPWRGIEHCHRSSSCRQGRSGVARCKRHPHVGTPRRRFRCPRPHQPHTTRPRQPHRAPSRDRPPLHQQRGTPLFHQDGLDRVRVGRTHRPIRRLAP